MRARGFTLIELLLALAIAALISVGTLALFNTSINAKDVVDGQSEEFSTMNRAMRLLEQDLIQTVPYRAVRDPFGDYQPAVLLDFEGLQLTRAGWAQSPFLTFERSSLQRVRYRLAEPGSELCPWTEPEDSEEGGCLVRSYRAHLDDDGYQTWQHQQLLRPVEAIDWSFLVEDRSTLERQFVDEPPTGENALNEPPRRLLAIQFSLRSSGRDYERLFRVPVMPSMPGEQGGSGQ